MRPIASNGYTVYFNESGLEQLNRQIAEMKYSSIFVICDANTNEHCVPAVLQAIAAEVRIEIIEIEAGEAMKTINSCVEIWNILTELGADRKSLILNVGGGVITDLGGFVASTYKRGIDFINIPTSLLGMVDASIGGKNGVDLGNLKNQVGTITSPKMVVINTVFLQTLPQNEMRSGLAEMLKHGLIADEKYWNAFADISDIGFDEFDQLIYRSVEIKNEIVIKDPTENGIRKALNFGHTLGHAIEGYFLESAKPLLHGEAIAAGMILESHISVQKNLLSGDAYKQVKKTIKNTFEDIAFTASDVSEIQKLLIHDKKNEYGKVLFALIDRIGHIVIDQNAGNDMISKAFEDYIL